MKILLREYGNENYVWVSAKYNMGQFLVDNEPIVWTNVISVINDNRKKYVQCSCCGQVFKRGDRRFNAHKANAIKPETCFTCDRLYPDEQYIIESKYSVRPDGTFCEKLEREVALRCTKCDLWFYPDICSNDAIRNCKKRQCVDATEIEIEDFFTLHPGVFDDIITIDRLLDDGYEVGIDDRRDSSYDIVYDDAYTIGVIINKIGIVDRFFVWFEGDKYLVYYSKKYDEIFTPHNGKYVVWNPWDMSNELRNEIKSEIKKLYR